MSIIQRKYKRNKIYLKNWFIFDRERRKIEQDNEEVLNKNATYVSTLSASIKDNTCEILIDEGLLVTPQELFDLWVPWKNSFGLIPSHRWLPFRHHLRYDVGSLRQQRLVQLGILVRRSGILDQLSENRRRLFLCINVQPIVRFQM